MAWIQSDHTAKLIDSMVTNDLLAPFGDRVYGRRFHAPRVMAVLLARH